MFTGQSKPCMNNKQIMQSCCSNWSQVWEEKIKIQNAKKKNNNAIMRVPVSYHQTHLTTLFIITHKVPAEIKTDTCNTPVNADALHA